MLTISVTNGFYRDEDTALENQTSHELARAEVIDVLGNDNFLREVAKTRITPGRKAVGQPAPCGQVDTTYGIAEMADCGRFAAGPAYLLFVHVFYDELVAASECMRRRSERHGEQEQYAGQFESIRFERSGRMHFLSPGMFVKMSVQNSKYAKSRSRLSRRNPGTRVCADGCRVLVSRLW